MSMTESNARLLRGSYSGDLDEVRAAITDGAEVDFVPSQTGLGALHLAVGRSHVDVLKYLVEEAGAQVKQDGFGRWPTLIAAECRSSEEVCDYIVQREVEVENSASRELTEEPEIDDD